MQWIRYELKTTTDASSRIGELLTEFGVNGYELQDNVPLSAEEERKLMEIPMLFIAPAHHCVMQKSSKMYQIVF